MRINQKHRTLCLIALLPLASLLCLPSTSQAAKLNPVARLSDFRDWVTSVAFSDDGHWLAVGSFRKLHLYDTNSWKLEHKVTVQSGGVTALEFLPDGKRIAVGSYQRVAIYEIGRRAPLVELKGHRGQVTALSLSPGGSHLASSSDDETARIWNLETGETTLTLRGAHGPMMGVAYSPDGQHLVTASGDPERVTGTGHVQLWDVSDGTLKSAFPNHKRAATGVLFTSDGKHVVSCSRDETLNVYTTASNEALGFYGGHSRPVNAVALIDDRIVCSASGGRAIGKNEVHLWSLAEGETLASAESAAPILCVAVSPKATFVAAGTQQDRVEVWKIEGLNEENSPANETASDPAAKPAGKTVVPQRNELGQQQVNRTETNKSQLGEFVTTRQPFGNAKSDAAAATGPIRVGIIGLDTSHVIAFTKVLNDPNAAEDVANCRVVAAYPKGSPDIESSTSRVPKYTAQMVEMGVKIVDSIDELLEQVDVVLLETNDGRPHLEQLLPCLKAGKPTFIDKPIAGSLSDAVAIFEAARQYDVPVFSSSSLRYSSGAQALRNGSLGKIFGCETHSPCSLEKTHPDLFWYGIHGVETLFTVMGPGCESVTRVSTPGIDVVVGAWEGGRVGSFRGIRQGKAGYGGTAFGEKGIAPVGSYEGYRPLLVEIVKFFRTKQPPIAERETLEIYAFMEAADESLRQGGSPVTLESVLAKARVAAERRLAELQPSE